MTRTARLRTRTPFQTIYRILDDAYGPQHWWPGETGFEVMAGAVLTQNTAWRNVERAIANLKRARLLAPQAILNADDRRLADQLRPAGYYNVKAGRLTQLCRWLQEQGGETALHGWTTERLRRGLLGVKGIGPETADAILLYAFKRPVFVIDAYTRRVYSRLHLVNASAPYESLRQTFQQALGCDERLFNQYHALIVNHAKVACRPKPNCGECVLRAICPSADSR